MVIFVIITKTTMSSSTQLSLSKRIQKKNEKRKQVVKTLRNGSTKRLIKPQVPKEEKISHFFFPQSNCNLTIKQNVTVVRNENAIDKKSNVEKENETNMSASTVGFLKMSPYRKHQNPKPLSNHASRKRPKSIQSLQNATSHSWNHTYTMQETVEKKPKVNKPVEKKITEIYSVRRSGRKTNSVIKKEKENLLIDSVLSNQEDGLEVVEFSTKGRGVVATRNFSRNEFVVEYAGDLIAWPEAKQRERLYSMDSTIGCYMYYFSTKGQNFCIDATAESGRIGRLLNHSKKNPNCYTKLVWVPNPKTSTEEPHLVILAKRDVEKDEELTYDYGDRDKSAIEVHPWLKS